MTPQDGANAWTPSMRPATREVIPLAYGRMLAPICRPDIAQLDVAMRAARVA